MNQSTTPEQLLDMWEKSLEDVRKIHESQKLLLRACKAIRWATLSGRSADEHMRPALELIDTAIADAEGTE